MIEIRPFERRDRDRLARLVNAHVAAATPGGSVPVSTLLGDLERPLGEELIGPWVIELATFVAEERGRLLGATHLRRYTGEATASEWYRDAGEIRWLLFWPDEITAGHALCERSLDQLIQWGVRIQYADGSLPAPGVYGVPDCWPHVRRLYERAGFDPTSGQREIILVGRLDHVQPPGDTPIEGMSLRREVSGTMGVAFHAILGDEVVGSYEVDDDLTRAGSNLAFSGWADECNHWVREDLRRRGIGAWLLMSAASWLRLGGTSRLMTYVIDGVDAEDWTRYYARFGISPINRTTRGWRRTA